MWASQRKVLLSQEESLRRPWLLPPAQCEQQAQGRCLLKDVLWLTRTCKWPWHPSCKTSNKQPLEIHTRHMLTSIIVASQSSSISPRQRPNTTRLTVLPLSLLGTWNYYSCSAVLRGFSHRKKGIAYSPSVLGATPVPEAAWQWGGENDLPISSFHLQQRETGTACRGEQVFFSTAPGWILTSCEVLQVPSCAKLFS